MTWEMDEQDRQMLKDAAERGTALVVKPRCKFTNEDILVTASRCLEEAGMKKEAQEMLANISWNASTRKEAIQIMSRYLNVEEKDG